MQPITRSSGAWPAQVTINSAQTYEFDAPAMRDCSIQTSSIASLPWARSGQYIIRARASVGLVFQDSSGSSFYIDASFDLIIGVAILRFGVFRWRIQRPMVHSLRNRPSNGNRIVRRVAGVRDDDGWTGTFRRGGDGHAELMERC